MPVEDVRRYPSVGRNAYKLIQRKGGCVVQSNVRVSRGSTRRRGTGQAHAAHQETTTRQARRDLRRRRRRRRAFSSGGGGTEDNADGYPRG